MNSAQPLKARYIEQRIESLSSFCVICDQPHGARVSIKCCTRGMNFSLTIAGLKPACM
jgi:hypothetical protein